MEIGIGDEVVTRRGVRGVVIDVRVHGSTNGVESKTLIVRFGAEEAEMRPRQLTRVDTKEER